MKYAFAASILLLTTCAQAQSFQEPQPYGGQRGVKMLFEEELDFPKEALDAGVKGNVNLKFIVNADGTTRDLKVWQPLHKACDEEAIRLCRMIRWRPAQYGGLPRAAEHYLRVPFEPKKFAKYLKARAGKDGSKMAADQDMKLYAATELDTLPDPIITGGISGLTTYLGREMKYPSEALKRNIQGTVLLEFVVEPTGTITNLEAVKSLGGGCSLEAQRLIRSIDWKPGSKDGVPVRGIMQVRMDFRLRASR